MIRLAAILLLASAAPLCAERGRQASVPAGPPPLPQRVASVEEVGLLPQDRRGKDFPNRTNPFAIPTASPVVADEPVLDDNRPEDYIKTLPIQGIMLGASPMVMLGDMIIRENELVPQALVPYDGEIVVTKIERGFVDFHIKPNALAKGGSSEPYPWRMQVTLSAIDAVKSRFSANPMGHGKDKAPPRRPAAAPRPSAAPARPR